MESAEYLFVMRRYAEALETCLGMLGACKVHSCLRFENTTYIELPRTRPSVPTHAQSFI